LRASRGQLAAERGDLENVSALRQGAEHEAPGIKGDDPGRLARALAATQYGILLAGLSGNPLLEIFADVLRHMWLEVLAGPTRNEDFDRVAASSEGYRLALTDAVVAGDGDLAFSLARTWFTTEFPMVMRPALEAKRRGQPAIGRAGLSVEMDFRWVLFGRPSKTAEALVRLLLREVRLRELKAGERIGAEAEILERYQVARPVLREAVRMLERHGIVDSRVGKAGGLYVGVADPETTVGFLVSELRGLTIRPEQVFELRLRLEP